jgi:hypothetical protein
MVADWDEDLACKMATLLTTMKLVLEMYGSCTIFGEQFCKLDNCREPSVSLPCQLSFASKSLEQHTQCHHQQ